MGMLMPMLGGVAMGYLLPDSLLLHPDQRLLFSLFVGVALSISALPVIAKSCSISGCARPISACSS